MCTCLGQFTQSLINTVKIVELRDMVLKNLEIKGKIDLREGKVTTII